MSRPEVYILKRDISGTFEEQDFEAPAREIMQVLNVLAKLLALIR